MGRIKVLAVDDNPDLVETIQEIFEAKFPQAEVTGALSGIEALKMMEETVPDLVLLDIMMPDMDGWAVTSKMHEDPRLKDVPIVYLTAKIDELSKRMGQVSSEDYIVKPFTSDDLINRVKTVLIRYKYMRKHLFLVTYGIMDALALAISTVTMTSVYLLLFGIIDPARLSPQTIAAAVTLAPEMDFPAVIVSLIAFIVLLYLLDHLLKLVSPSTHEEKRILHQSNIRYWRNNLGKLANEIPILWIVSFLPAYILKPTLTTAPIYVMVPMVFGIYRLAYKPVRLQWH